MSVSGITSSLLAITQPVHQRSEKFKQEFQQLGQNLQSGNLSAAQSDFAILSQYAPTSQPSSTQGLGNLAQSFKQLSADLQSGNISGAQQDYSNIQEGFQARAAQGHHHHGGGSEINQLLNQLGQDLQSGNTTAAQQAYSTLQNDLQQFAQSNGLTNTSPSASVFSASA